MRFIVITYARVFTTMDNVEGYQKMFSRIFNLMSKITGKPVQWQNIHNSGIKVVVADMDSKQFSGT